MDTGTISAILVAVIAIIPGIWSLINVYRKDNMIKEERIEKAYYTGHTAMGFIENMQNRVSKLQLQTSDMMDKLIDMDKTKDIDRLWDRMCEKPVIVHCEYCNSGNVITNVECIKCGAPLGGKNA